MWPWLITLGFVVLLAWKAPRVFKWLLVVVGGLALVAALVGGGFWLLNSHKQSRLAAQFDADPNGRTIPPTLHVYSKQESYGKYWAVFNSSPDTAYSCQGRTAHFNSAGVKLRAESSHESTFEPLQNTETAHSATEGSRYQLTQCIAEVRGQATVSPVRALVSSPALLKLPLHVRLNALRQTVEADPPNKAPESQDWSWDKDKMLNTVLFDKGDSPGEQVVKSFMETYRSCPVKWWRFRAASPRRVSS